MSTRKRTTDPPSLADLEGAANPAEAPGIMPPPGTEAQVKTEIRYNRVIVDPERYYSEDLRELAAEEDNILPQPDITDPLQEFLTTWQRFTGYYIRVTRLPDPAANLLPGQSFNRQCREVTALGGTTFDPLNFEHSIQSLAGNSGGVFRVFLVDHNGQQIPDAKIDRVTIADPPRLRGNNSIQRQYLGDVYDIDLEPHYRQRQPPPQPAPAPPQKSASEERLDQLKDSLFEKLLIRALDPPAPPAPDPLSALSPDDRLALGLLQRGDILESAVNRIASLAQAPDRIESSTWKDKLADAGLQLVTNNPQIVATATDILSRAAVAITTALSTAFAPRQAQVINEPIPVQHPPAQRVPVPQIQRTPQAVNGLPETPQPEDEGSEEDAEIDMMEEIVKLLLSDRPLRLDDPVILEIKEAYPAIFERAMLGIVAMPSATIIQYLCGKSDFCADMFQSATTGPHLRQRLEELKLLLNPANAANNEVTTETAPSA